MGLNGQTSFYGIDAAAKGSYNASQTEGASFKSYGVAVERKANNLSWEWTFSPLTKIDAAATVAKAYVKSEIVPAVAGEGPPKLWGTESVPFFARLWDLPAGLCQEATWYVPLEEPSTTGKMTLKGSVAYAQTGTGRFYCDFHIDYTPSLDDLKKEGQRLSVEFSLQTAVGKHTLTLKPSPVSFDVPIVPSVVRMSQSLLQSTYQNGTYTWHFDYEPRNLGNLVLLGFTAQKLVCGSQNILTFHAEPAIGPAYKVPATLYVYETEISAPEGVCTFSATPEFSNTGNRPAIVGPTMESSRLQWKPTSSPAVASSAAAPNVVPGTAQPKVAATPLAAGSPN